MLKTKHVILFKNDKVIAKRWFAKLLPRRELFFFVFFFSISPSLLNNFQKLLRAFVDCMILKKKTHAKCVFLLKKWQSNCKKTIHDTVAQTQRVLLRFFFFLISPSLLNGLQSKLRVFLPLIRTTKNACSHILLRFLNQENNLDLFASQNVTCFVNSG